LKEVICYDDDCYRKAECDKNVKTDNNNICLEYTPEDVMDDLSRVII